MWPERVLSGGFWRVSGVKVEFESAFGAAMHREVEILGKIRCIVVVRCISNGLFF